VRFSIFRHTWEINITVGLYQWMSHMSTVNPKNKQSSFKSQLVMLFYEALILI